MSRHLHLRDGDSSHRLFVPAHRQAAPVRPFRVQRTPVTASGDDTAAPVQPDDSSDRSFPLQNPAEMTPAIA